MADYRRLSSRTKQMVTELTLSDVIRHTRNLIIPKTVLFVLSGNITGLGVMGNCLTACSEIALIRQTSRSYLAFSRFTCLRGSQNPSPEWTRLFDRRSLLADCL